MLNGCTSTITYKIEENVSDSQPTIQAVKIYHEASMSMRGFVKQVNPNENYKLRTVVPYLITECRHRLDSDRKLYTFITDTPDLYSHSDEKFRTELCDGNILSGLTSKFHNLLKSVIDSTHSGELSFFISDCILDLGQGKTLQDQDQIQTSLYDQLVKRNNFSAVVFQYLSDFNGDYYYCYNNNQPYSGQELNNHPFYIWIFGEPELIEYALAQDIITDYDNVYYWGVKRQGVNPQLIKHPCKGKWVPFTEENKIEIIDISKAKPITFTIALNLQDLPDFAKEKEYLQSNLKIDKEFTGCSIKVNTREDYKSDGNPLVMPILAENQDATHFFELTLNALTSTTGNIRIYLPNNNWLEQTHLDKDLDENDLVLPTDSLEMKTFSFNYITDAFNRHYGKSKNLFEIELNQIKPYN
jgi:hypothetical protein